MAVCYDRGVFVLFCAFWTGFYNNLGRGRNSGRMVDCVDYNAVQHDTVGSNGVHKHLERLRQAVGAFIDIVGDNHHPYYLYDIFDKSDGTMGCAGGNGNLVCVGVCSVDERVLREGDSFGGKADVRIHISKDVGVFVGCFLGLLAVVGLGAS